MVDNQIRRVETQLSFRNTWNKGCKCNQVLLAFPLSSSLCVYFIVSLKTTGNMAAAFLEFILYIFIPQTKFGFKVVSIVNLKIPGQISIPGPSVCLGSSDWASLGGNMVALQWPGTRLVMQKKEVLGWQSCSYLLSYLLHSILS